ncbi:hypothetical protein Q8F55_006114 [Vanrija albida]|uniref:Zn(2)-C6 fungal-type domain-containing protein n=1 Tax=Vanrija albida TaxID=181172 RepID=A0ABR3Q3Q8_9TREE
MPAAREYHSPSSPQPVFQAPQACKRCYSRKRKCDRRHPKCSACIEANVPCELDGKAAQKSLFVQLNELRAGTVDLQKRIEWLEGYIRQASPALGDIAVRPTGSQLPQPLLYDTPAPLAQPANVTTSAHLSTLVSSGATMRVNPNSPPLALAGSSANSPPITSAALHPGLPTLDEALEWTRAVLATHNQSRHCISPQEIEDDTRAVYGENGLIAPGLSASRFRTFAVIYLGAMMKNRGDGHISDSCRACRAFAFQELPNVTAQEDLTAVQALALMSLISLYEPGGPSLFQVVGFAARTALSIGIHRRDEVYFPGILDTFHDEAALRAHNEKRKNIFWAVYSLDRLAVFTLGLPPAIRDSDIDVDQPTVPISSSEASLEVPEVALRIHNIQLRRLYGKIYESLLTVPARDDLSVAEREAIISDRAREVQEWYNNSPFRAAFFPMSDSSISRQAADDISYHQMTMGLYRPSPLMPHVPSSYVTILKSSASISVDLYRHYWPRQQVLLVWTHLYQVFSSCTTLVYCFCEYRSRPDLVDLPSEQVETQIAQCQDLLARFGSAWPESQRYQAMFHALVQSFRSSQPSPTQGVETEAIQPLSMAVHQVEEPSEQLPPPPAISVPSIPSVTNGGEVDLSIFDLFNSTQASADLPGSVGLSGSGTSPSSVMMGFWAPNLVPNA